MICLRATRRRGTRRNGGRGGRRRVIDKEGVDVAIGQIERVRRSNTSERSRSRTKLDGERGEELCVLLNDAAAFTIAVFLEALVSATLERGGDAGRLVVGGGGMKS